MEIVVKFEVNGWIDLDLNFELFDSDSDQRVKYCYFQYHLGYEKLVLNWAFLHTVLVQLG